MHRRSASTHGQLDSQGKELDAFPSRAASSGDLHQAASASRKVKAISQSPRGTGRGGDSKTRLGGRTSRRGGFFRGVGAFLLRFLTDFVTFLARGGVSTMMFLMDQAVSVGIAAISWIPGSAYIGYGVRSVIWLFHMVTWVLYMAFELIFYLPPLVLLLYLFLMACLVLYMPELAQTVLSAVLWVSHSFLQLLKYTIYSNQPKQQQQQHHPQPSPPTTTGR